MGIAPVTTEPSYGAWKFCAWHGTIFMVVFIVFWGYLGHNLPHYGGDVEASVIAAYWYSIWVGITFTAECLMPFFKPDPFARQGILNFWIEFMIFFVYAPIITCYMIKGINRIRSEAGDAAGSATHA